MPYPIGGAPAPSLPLLRAEDALAVVLGHADPARPGVVCLLLDGAHRGLACLDIAGGADAGAVLDVAEVVLAAVAEEVALAAVVLASVRPLAGHRPELGEACCFLELAEQFDDAGIELLDWFVVGPDRVTSLAEVTGSPSRWRPAGPGPSHDLTPGSAPPVGPSG